jgi:hypothetical protein
MDANRFDDLVRGAADRVQSRRGVLFGVAAASMTLAFSLDAAEAGKGRRSRRPRRNVRVCFKGREIVVNRTAARELVSRGARRGRCVPAGSPGIPGCSANNGFCSGNQASCLGTPECGCFMTVESDTICGNLSTFQGCPTTTNCTTSDDCHDFEFCVDLSCCPEGKAVCVPLCVPPE